MPATSSQGLSDEQRRQLLDRGYLVIEDLIDLPTIEAVRAEIHEFVDATARQMHAEGLLPQTWSEAGFDRQLAAIAQHDLERARELIQRIHNGKGGEGGHIGPGIFDLMRHPALLDCIEDLVGPEIIGSSVYRIRPKAPGIQRGAVPWHQDSGYLLSHCDRNLIITCWIPLVDADLENGCLYVIPDAHRDGIFEHRRGGPGGYLVIEDSDLPAGVEPIPVPVPKGGVLLLTNLTPHASYLNQSDIVRWSVDLRYQSPDVPNNLNMQKDDITDELPDIEVACYPPEADFVLRSQSEPSKVVPDWQTLKRIRDRYATGTLKRHIAGRWKQVNS